MDRTECLARAMIVQALAPFADALIDAEIEIGPLVDRLIDYLFLESRRNAKVQ
jgi:hypothetical protein